MYNFRDQIEINIYFFGNERSHEENVMKHVIIESVDVTWNQFERNKGGNQCENDTYRELDVASRSRFKEN